MQLGFAIVPLIHFVSDKATMGQFVIKLSTKILAWTVAGILVFLNVRLVVEESIKVFDASGNVFLKLLVVAGWLIFSWLFIMMSILPIIRRRKEKASVSMHAEEKPLHLLQVPSPRKIAIALDFRETDEKIIAHATIASSTVPGICIRFLPG
jgi:manganese transport protein